MVEGRHDERRSERRARIERLEVVGNRPYLALVRERYALGQAGGSGRIENLRQILLAGLEGRQLSPVEESLEAIRTGRIEIDDRHTAWNQPRMRGIHEGELDRAVAEHVRDGRRGKAVVDGYCDGAHAHGAAIGCHELEPVRRQDSDTGAGADPAAHEAPGARHDELIELRRGEGARLVATAQVEVRGPIRERRQSQDVAQISRRGHAHPLLRAG